jgi:hypothetical protein
METIVKQWAQWAQVHCGQVARIQFVGLLLWALIVLLLSGINIVHNGFSG